MTRRTRILYLEPSALLTGGSIALLRLVEMLDRTRFAPIVVLGSEGPLVREFRGVPGCRVLVRAFPAAISRITRFRVFAGGLWHLPVLVRYICGIRRLAERLHPDITHSNGLKMHFVSALVGPGPQGALIWHVRDYIDASYMPSRIAWLVRHLANRIPDFVICNSDATKRTLIHGERVMTIPSGVPSLSRPRRTEEVCRIYDGVGSARFPGGQASAGRPARVAILGRVARWKGQHVFLEAAMQLIGRHGDARFIVAGGATTRDDQAYLDALVEKARRSGKRGRIVFAGWVRNVPKLLSGTDILVHASLSPEPFGQVVIEGMAMGIPVVAADSGGPSEIIANGVDGFLYPSGDAKTLAGIVDELLASRDRRRAIGDAGRKTVANRFTIEATAESVMKVYDQLCGSRRPVRP